VIWRTIAFGIQAAGCFYVGYWAVFFRKRGLRHHQFLRARTWTPSSAKIGVPCAPITTPQIIHGGTRNSGVGRRCRGACRPGKEGRVMRVRGDMLLIGCRSAHRLELVLAKCWEVLPERNWRRLEEREKGMSK
jgi:hypothetical protein